MTMTNMAPETTRNVGLMGKMKNFITRSRAERKLHQLDDRMLADIGIVRGEITSRVWGN